MNECPHIAVIMSVYRLDNASALTLAIDSILKQTVSNDLLIYQDGPISDDLSQVLERYSRLGNVKLFKSNENKGLAAGLNFLINYAVGVGYKYIARMDSDDISYSVRLKIQSDFLDSNHDVHVLGTSCREFGSSYALKEKHLPICHSELIKFSIIRSPFIHPTVMFRASVFQQGYRYPENTVLTEDMAFWFILLDNGFKFSNINDVLLDYRLDENTVHRRKGLKKALNELKIRLFYMARLKQFSLKNMILICVRFFFHLMPVMLIKWAYKNAR